MTTTQVKTRNSHTIAINEDDNAITISLPTEDADGSKDYTFSSAEDAREFAITLKLVAERILMETDWS